MTKNIQKSTILYLEDDQLHRQIIQEYIKIAFDVNLIVEDNGMKGIIILKNESKIDLVITNLMMPRIDGFRVIEFIRSNEKLKSIPIIVTSAHCTNEIIERCYKLGANEYLISPVDLVELKNLIVKYISTIKIINSS